MPPQESKKPNILYFHVDNTASVILAVMVVLTRSGPTRRTLISLSTKVCS
jgi:hypothetical protein